MVNKDYHWTPTRCPEGGQPVEGRAVSTDSEDAI